MDEQKKKSRSMVRLAAATLLLAAPFAGGCGKDEGSPEEEDPAEHACEHAAIAGTAVTAGAARDEGAGEMTLGHDPFTVTLVAGAAGYVWFDVAEPTDALLFAGTADVVQGLFHGDEEETLPAAAPNEFCPDDVPEHFDLELHEAGTYFVEVGPAATPDVWLMVSLAEGHAHE